MFYGWLRTLSEAKILGLEMIVFENMKSLYKSYWTNLNTQKRFCIAIERQTNAKTLSWTTRASYLWNECWTTASSVKK